MICPEIFAAHTVNIKSTIIGGEENNVRLQNLRDFTVQIRRWIPMLMLAQELPSQPMARSLLALMLFKLQILIRVNLNGAEVGVYFPQAAGARKRIAARQWSNISTGYEDDVVLLQLTGGPSPLAPEQIASSWQHGGITHRKVESFGYRLLWSIVVSKIILREYASRHHSGTCRSYTERK